MKRILIHISLLLGVLFALSSIPLSGAIQQETVIRGTNAYVVTDASGAIILTGFDNPIVTISRTTKQYFSIGSITNNSNQHIMLTVTITPTITLNGKKYWVGMKIGGVTQEFIYGSTTPADITLSLSPGQTVDVQGGLMDNKNKQVPISFRFSSVSADGNVRVLINDTANTPRRITLK